eukprot:TRINITY_DN21074_c0_g1_i2.p1 TRINITY_DN21074_c0_g1~~TRINITY_DN21074_c0_g1_i2.p1  ORF type:complete len:111 (+),score=19.58 TRINITY_DN21074_c0_g1_i2:34-366(+)
MVVVSTPEGKPTTGRPCRRRSFSDGMPGLNSPSGKEASAAAAAAAAANDRGGDNAEQVMAALLDHHGLVAPQGFDATAAVVAANLPAESSTLSVCASRSCTETRGVRLGL